MKETFVILVDENDAQIGLMEKMEAHKKALLQALGDMNVKRQAYHGNVFVNNHCNDICSPGTAAL